MDEDFSWMSFIRSNLTKLVKSTIIGTDLTNYMLEKKLINDEEKEFLMEERTSNSKKASELYTKFANRWIDSDFEKFKIILKDTDNKQAFAIFKNATPNASLGKDSEEKQKETELTNKQMKDEKTGGVSEGLSLEEEISEEVKTQEIAEFLVKYPSLIDDVRSKEGRFISEMGIPIPTMFPSIDECTRGSLPVEQLIYKVISKWYNGNGRAATTGKLYEAFKNIGFIALAEELEIQYGKAKRVRDQLSSKSAR